MESNRWPRPGHTRPGLGAGRVSGYLPGMRPERFRKLQEVLDRRQPDLTVLMERVHKPHNLSAILRNCDAAGVLEAHAVVPDDGLELHHDTSGGTTRWIRVHRWPDVEEAGAALKAEGFRILAADPGEGSGDYRRMDLTGPTAFMMGAELYGLSDRGLELADARIEVPLAGMVASLNVSVATALLLFEAKRQREAAGMYDESRLDPERRKQILFEWAYPRVARRLRAAGRAYPELDEDGGIVERLRD